MKRLLLVMLILASFSTVYAADKAADASSPLKISGDFYVGGNMAQNVALDKSGKKTYSFFDYDLNLNAQFKANDNATFNMKLTYDKNVDKNQSGYGANYLTYPQGTGNVPKVEQSNQEWSKSVLAVERAYLNYKFNTAFQLDAGLMGGGQWGTLFGNTEVNVMRLKLTYTAAEGMDFLAIYQKNAEEADGTNMISNSEKNDDNTYYLGAKLNFAPIKVQPLFSYQTAGKNHGDGDSTNNGDKTVMGADIAVLGDFGSVGFESEFVYTSSKAKGTSKDADGKNDKKMGAYANIFAKIDPAKVGFVYAYASDKSDKGEGVYSWGKDFDVTIVMDDFTEYTVPGTGSAFNCGWSVYKVYAESSVGAFSFGAALAYGADNVKNGKKTFTELDVNLGYALDAQTDYSVNAGYAMTNKMNATNNKGNCFAMYHGMKIKF